MNEFFHRFASAAARWVGTSWAFITAVSIVIIWSVTGPIFHYSDTWQLVINTGTTIITFLTVFLIQNTQNRDARAIHLKLDELIRSIKAARNSIIDLEDLSDEELNRLQKQFQQIHERGDSDNRSDVNEAKKRAMKKTVAGNREEKQLIRR